MTRTLWTPGLAGLLVGATLAGCLGGLGGDSPGAPLNQTVPPPPYCAWDFREWKELTCTLPKPEGSPWCEAVIYTPNPKDVRRANGCRSGRIGDEDGMDLVMFSLEDLAGQKLTLEAGPIKQFPPDPEENGRPFYVVVWNRTGRALYQEWGVRVGERQNFTVTLPSDPPYFLRVGDVAVSTVLMYATLPGRWVHSSGIGALFFGNWSFNQTLLFRELWGHVDVPVGQTRGTFNATLPPTLIYLNTGCDCNATGHTQGNFSIWDPWGRLNYYYDNSALTGSRIYNWGTPPLDGSWQVRLELPRPALFDTSWPVQHEYEYLNPDVLRRIGFAHA